MITFLHLRYYYPEEREDRLHNLYIPDYGGMGFWVRYTKEFNLDQEKILYYT